MLAGSCVCIVSCFGGETFRGYDELEREVLGHLAAEIKQRSLDNTFIRMIMVNLAAQFYAGERFQGMYIMSGHVLFVTNEDDSGSD